MSYAFFKKKEMIARWAVPEDAVLPDAQPDQASVQQPRNDMPADSGGQISSVQDGDGKEEEEEYMSEDDNGSETEPATDAEKKRKAETPKDEKRPKFARNYGQTLYISALLHQLKIYAAE